jgi:hypothetical protein
MKSLIIYLESEYDYWYSDLLIDKENCIKIKKIKEIPAKLKWCIKNDAKCEKIAENAHKLFVKLWDKENLFNYVQGLSNQVNYLYAQ